MQGRLIPCGGGDPIPLIPPRVVIGRNPDCNVVLRVPSVSGRHCQLDWADWTWSVRDLGSRNGIRVDGVRCEVQRLPPGSVLWIASLRYRVSYLLQGPGPAEQGPSFSESLLKKAGLEHWQPPPGGGGRRQGEDEGDPPRPRYTLDES
jgi:pSer/pThr/pTyr-binding forkhead associated (FHA) protein